jgi:hypothetical protein
MKNVREVAARDADVDDPGHEGGLLKVHRDLEKHHDRGENRPRARRTFQVAEYQAKHHPLVPFPALEVLVYAVEALESSPFFGLGETLEALRFGGREYRVDPSLRPGALFGEKDAKDATIPALALSRDEAARFHVQKDIRYGRGLEIEGLGKIPLYAAVMFRKVVEDSRLAMRDADAGEIRSDALPVHLKRLGEKSMKIPFEVLLFDS